MDWYKNEWRSITPEREFGQMIQSKPLITEPNENKQSAKSMSQDNQEYSKIQNLNKFLYQDSKFQRPLSHMQTSLKKISEIGQQINTILSKCKHSRKPQSDLLDKNALLKKTSQNDISLQVNHSYMDNRGTETERSYFYQKNQKDGGLKFQKKDSTEYQQIIQATSQLQTNSLKKIIEKKLIAKPNDQQRSKNIQKYITHKLLRNSSCLCEQQMSSYYSQNHYSKSQSSFLVERENSKSENTTSRNNRIRVSSYIKTPTKNTNELVKQFSPRFISQQLSSYQVSSSKINSLLSSMNKDIDRIACSYGNIQNLNIYHLQTVPLFLQNDPNQTHILVGCQDQSIRIINLYSGRISILGKHNRQIKSMTKVVIQQNFKTFYTASQDKQIIQWISDSMHGTYRIKQSWRMDEVPLLLHQTEKGVLYIVTANYIHYYSSVMKKEIQYQGVFRHLIQTSNNILVAIDNSVYKLQADTLQLLSSLNKQIKHMIYEGRLLYVLTQSGSLLVFEEQKKLKLNSELEIGTTDIYSMQNGQIIIQTNESDFIVYSQQISKSYSIDGKIKCLLALQQLLLIGSNKKIIETIKL